MLWPRQRRTAKAPEGCCPGPYVTVAPACKTNVQLWLWPAHLMHQADTAATCHMGRPALCPHQLTASSWWTKLESPSGPTLSRPPRKKDTNVCWCAERDREGQSTYASRVASRAPAPTTRPLPEASTPSRSSAAEQAHRPTHPKQPSTLRQGRPEHEPTGPEHRHSPSEGTEFVATCYKPRAKITPKGGRRRHRPANPTFMSSCCHLNMSRREEHQHGSCRLLSKGPGHACQVHLGFRIADCHAADKHWVHNCLQGWCIIHIFKRITAKPST